MEIDLRRAGTELDSMEADASLWVTRNLERRSRALDELAFLQDLFRVRGLGEEESLVRRAGALQRGLEQIDGRLYERIRSQIRSGDLRGARLRSVLARYAGEPDRKHDSPITGYDTLDVLVHGLFLRRPTPEESVPRSLEMVQYEATPARVVLAMIGLARIGPDDVFLDLGAGLGHVVLLVRLLTGARAYGIELDPEFCAYARASAEELAVTGTRFIAEDAREADYGKGTVYFMFTPFRGAILQAVLERLRKEATRRPIRVCTYGTCTVEVAKAGWLRVEDASMVHEFRLAVFHSQPSLGHRGP